jgi:hypothetical protein
MFQAPQLPSLSQASPYTYPTFGFQLTTVRSLDVSPVQCGAFIATVLPRNTQLTNVLGGVRMFQHDGGIAPDFGAGEYGSLYKVSTVWTAPTDADSVVICAVVAFPKASATDTQMWNTSKTVYYRQGFLGVRNLLQTHAANVYPNPANDAARVVFGDANVQVSSIRLFDMGGREVTQFRTSLSAGEATLSLNDLSGGLYYGFATTCEKAYFFKIVKE